MVFGAPPAENGLASRFAYWYRGLTIAHKLRLFPQLTATALGSVLLVTVGFGVLAERRLERLGNQYYPVVESSWRLGIICSATTICEATTIGSTPSHGYAP